MERYRTTIILAVLLVVLGGIAFALSNNNASTSATPTPAPTQYVWQETGDVTAIDVISGSQTVSVRKDVSSTVWTLITPIKDTADNYQVQSAVDNLKSLKAMNSVTGTTDLAQFGLDKKGLTIDIKTGGDKPAKHEAQVGNTIIDGSGYYLKTSDSNTVYVVDYSIIEPLKNWFQFPPKQQPTPTPLPLTVAPTNTITPTQSITGTQAPATTATGTVTLTLPITSTTTISGTSAITTTAPGAANPTTPLSTPAATATP